jgi:chromosome segregation ATPase
MEEMEARMGRPMWRRSSGRRVVSEPSNITNEQMILLRIVVNLEETNIGIEIKPAAEEFMNVAIEYLRSALENASEEHKNRLSSQLNLANEEASRTEDQLSQMQERLRRIAGSRILDKDNILGDIMDLRHKLQDIRMERDSDDVIVEAITGRIAETRSRLEDQVARDDITLELQTMINRQAQNLINTKKMVEAGQAGPSELTEAEEKLVRAKIELAQRREEMSRTAGGDLIESLNRELADRSIKTAQNRANIEALSRQLAEAEEWLNKADDHELLSLKADIAKQNLREVLVWRDRISRRMRLIQPPAVSVLGGQ